MFGPRILPSGRGLTRTGGHADSNFFPQDFVREHHPWGVIADGPEEVRKAVRGVLREGAQFVKLWASGGGINDYEKETDTHFTEEEIAMMVSEAREFGKKVAAHCENKDSIIKCLKAGVDSIEHGEEIDEEVVAWIRENMTQEELDRVTLVPTIGLYVDWYEQFDPPKERDLTGCVGDTLGQKEIDRIHKSFTRAFKDLGIRVAVGADSFCTKLNPYGMYTHNEMYALVEAGMTKYIAYGIAMVVGNLYPIFSPFIALLGGYVTSSGTSSNNLFTNLQEDVATVLGISVPIILSCQTAEAALSNSFSPGNAALGTGVSGQSGREGEILAATGVYNAIQSLVLGVVAYVLIKMGFGM
jgi:hypothetical protein